MKARLLALADRPPHIDPVHLARSGDVDVIVTLGDLQPSWAERLDTITLPKLGVLGNHDSEPYLDWFGIENLHMRRIELDCGLTLAGFEGCVSYRRGGGPQGPSYTQREARRLARRLPAADILVCHCPPRGINDDESDPAHVGFDALREWVDRHRPRLLLHGHTYPQPGQIVDRYRDTRVAYVSGACIVDLVL